MDTFDPDDVWLHDDVLTVDLAGFGWADGMVRRAVVGGRLPHSFRRSFTARDEIDDDGLLPAGTIVRGDHVSAESRDLLVSGAGVLLQVSLHGLHVSVTAACSTAARRDEVLGHFVRAFPVAVGDPDQVPVDFVYHENGPVRIERAVTAHAWADVRANYPVAAAEALDRLVKQAGEPTGRVVLLHGPPGTGKTSALLTLAREWREWCDVAFVLDPDSLFAGNPGYLVQLILETAGGRWTLLVVEDAAELLRPTGSDGMHPGLARLLNLSDGAVGQGLRVMVCITTNEPIASLHPAIRRPGRCLADVSIGHLSTTEAGALLPDDVPAAGPMVLAEVLARRGDIGRVATAPEEPPIGQYL